METKNLPIRIRRATDGDVSFIFSSWLKSYRTALVNKNIPSEVYFTEHHKVIEDLLKTCEVLIACNEKDATDIYGYICAERVDGIFVVHYIYVKHTYRVLGVARMLINQFEHEIGVAAIYTHHTRIAERLAPKHGFVYSPYVAMTAEYRKKADRHKKLQEKSSLEKERRDMVNDLKKEKISEDE